MPAYPFVPGFEVAGVISAVGNSVRDFHVGDNVFALTGDQMGGHATQVNVPASSSARMPRNASFAEACSLPVVFGTVHYAFEIGRLERGEHVLIQTATGGCGLMALQLAWLKGSVCYGTSSAPAKLEILRRLGVAHALNYKTSEFDREIMKITDGRGVDVVLNMISGEGIQRGLNCLGASGRYLELATHALKTSARLDLSRLTQNQTIQSIDLRRLNFQKNLPTRSVLETAVSLFESGSIVPIVSRIYPAHQIREAMEFVGAGQHIGKVVISRDETTMVDLREDCIERLLDQKRRAQSAAAAVPIARGIASPVSNVPLIHEGIAIIGMSGRFPKSPTLKKFWENLAGGVDCISEVPPERWSVDKHYDPKSRTPGKTDCKWMGVLEDVDKFDPLFFNISPIEAEWMDPQQRLFLESCWHCIENAGVRPSSLSGSRCGVFVGCSAGDYGHAAGMEGVNAQGLMGGAMSVLAGRISYLLNLQGPCMAIDTACSASLVAIAEACNSLVLDHCDLALAGGVCVHTGPGLHIMASQAGMLSRDGRCFTFDNRANGFVPGEGVGVILLKRLSDALRDGDSIAGVIRGWGTNQDGKTNGITAPSVKSQIRLETELYRRFGIDPATISMVEAHGTGTKLGDPIEVEALTAAFRSFTDKKEFCALGSVKSNIGHLLTAAGISGVIKVLLAMKHQQLPPTVHFQSLNEHLQLAGSPFKVSTELKSWTSQDGVPRRATVSSFGFSGTNGHLVIEEYPGHSKVIAPKKFDSAAVDEVLPLSAKNEERLRASAAQLLDHLQTENDSLADIAFALQTGRDSMACRFAVVASSKASAIEQLKELALGKTALEFNANAIPSTLLGTVAGWMRGEAVDWNRVRGAGNRRRIALPGYPFARERHWIGSRQTTVTPRMDSGNAVAIWEPYWLEKKETAPAGRSAELQWIVLCECGDGAKSALEAEFPAARLLILKDGRGSIAQRFETYAQRLFGELKKDFERLPTGTLLLQFVHSTEGEGALFSGVSGLFKSIHLENPRFHGQLIEADSSCLEQGSEIAAMLRMAASHAADEKLRFEGGERPLEFAANATADGAAHDRDPGALGERRPTWNDRGALGERRPTRNDRGALGERRPTRNGRGALGEHRPTAEVAAQRPYLGRCFVQQWRKVKISAEAESHLASKKSESRQSHEAWWITGGAGGIGRLLALYITSIRKDVRLILTGRTPANAAISRSLETLRSDGVVVDYRQLDCSDAVAVDQFASDLKNEGIVLKAVFHVAGITRDSLIGKKSPSDFGDVLAPKVSGLSNVDFATRNCPLDFLILFSSTAAVFGNPGQVDYASANGFMDAFATHRNGLAAQGQRKGRTISINWPLWESGGMSVGGAGIRAMANLGLKPLGTSAAFAILEKILVLPNDHVMVLAESDKEVHAAGKPLPTPAFAESDLLARVTGELQRMLGEAIKLDPLRIIATEPLEAYGIDSILIATLNDRLLAVFPEVSKAIWYEEKTLAMLARHLVSKHPHESSQWTGFVVEEPELTSQNMAAPGTTQRPASRDVAWNEPIAIVGMSGRYPMADNLDAYWENLKSGRDCFSELSAHRWVWKGFEPREGKAGERPKVYGGFLETFDQFDPLFFNLTPAEALNIDPQERLILTACWEAMEEGGHSRASLRNRYNGSVGVFVGVTKSGFHLHTRLAPTLEASRFPISSFSSMANRVSYHLNLTGPSMGVDTMCSSSLTALHEACEHIRRGDCEVAFAGGVNLYLHPRDYVVLQLGKMISDEAQIQCYSKEGKGFIPGEGVGAVLLKPLSRAIADGDLIHGVIRGSSVRHGGKTLGYTVPSVGEQKELIEQTLRRSGCKALDIDYVESAANGSSMGDAIEFEALKQAFQSCPPQSCRLGTVKPSIGHLEAASGMSQLSKVLLQMKEATFAPTKMERSKLDPSLRWDTSPFRLITETESWPAKAEGSRTALITSFGAGGSYAAAVIESYPATSVKASVQSENAELILLSARTEKQLKAKAEGLRVYLENSLMARSESVALPGMAEARSESVALPGEDGGRRSAPSLPGMAEARSESVALPGEDGGRRSAPSLPGMAEARSESVALPGMAEARSESVALPGEDGGRRSAPSLPGMAEARSESVALPGMAATLQEGRDAMEFRFATIVRSKAELLENLDSFVANKESSACVIGRPDDLQTLIKFLSLADIAMLVEKALNKGDLESLARFWTKGFTDIQWGALRQKRPAVCHLPTYPFDQRSLWYNLENEASAPPARITVATGNRGGIHLNEEKQDSDGSAFETIKSQIVSIIRDILLLREEDEIGDDRTFFDLGLDSISSARLIQRLGTEMGVELPETLFFEHPTMNALAAHLANSGRGIKGVTAKQQVLSGSFEDRLRSVMERFKEVVPLQLEGDGPVLFCIHPMSGDVGLHGKLADASEKRFRVIGLKSRGGSPGTVPLTDIESMGIAHAEIIRAIDPIGPYHLFGPSMGGAVAYEITRHIQLKGGVVESLIMVEPPLIEREEDSRIWDADERENWLINANFIMITYLHMDPEFRKRKAAGEILWESLEIHAAEINGVGLERIEEKLVALIRGRGVTQDAKTLLGRLRTMAAVHLANLRALSRYRAQPSPFCPSLRVMLLKTRDSLAISNTLYNPGYLLEVQRQRGGMQPFFEGWNRLFPGMETRVIEGANHLDLLNTRTAAREMASIMEGMLLRSRAAIEPPAQPPAKKSKRTQKIAIIGMSGQFPGATTIDKFWELLKAGRSAFEAFPTDRNWDLEELFETALPHNRSYVQTGGFLSEAVYFDASFFGISSKEAEMIDPSERLFLQESWKAIEDAGISPASISGKNWGVFCGGGGDYGLLMHQVFGITPQVTVSSFAGRVAHCLNIKGPVMSVDAGCASALLSIAQACDQLSLGNCDAALAGGAMVYSTPNLIVTGCRNELFARDGQCRALDQTARGMVPGEAVAVVVLKCLDQAMADGDRIHGVIEGWGSNHNGKSNGLASPSATAESALFARVHGDFEIDPSTFGMIEANATSTRLGDTVEIEALTAHFGGMQMRPKSCVLGSVENNVGHAFQASGMAHLAKVLLALRHQEIPATPHVQNLNVALDQADSPFIVPRGNRPWTIETGKIRRAAINSFGATGINVHLVIAEGSPSRADRFRAPKPLHIFKRERCWMDRSRAQVAASQAGDVSVESFVLKRVGDCTGTPMTLADLDKPLAELGLESMASIRLLAAINEQFSTEISPTDLVDFDTPRLLAAAIQNSNGKAEKQQDVFHSITIPRESAFAAEESIVVCQPILAKLIQHGIAVSGESDACRFLAHRSIDIAAILKGLSEVERARLIKEMPVVFVAPVSQEQQRNLHHSEVLESPAWNIQHLFQCDLAAIDLDKLDRALSEVMAAHDILRTSYLPFGESWAQIIFPNVSWNCRRLVMPSAAAFQRFLLKEQSRLILVGQAPLFQIWVSSIKGALHLGMIAHHSVSDAFTPAMLISEILDRYGAVGEGRVGPTASTSWQYWQYALEQFNEAHFRGETARLFWTQRLANKPANIQLPSSVRPESLSATDLQEGETHIVSLGAVATERLLDFTRRHRTTFTQIFTAAIAVVCTHGVGNNGMVMRCMHSRRDRKNLVKTMGEFSNVLFLPIEVDAAGTLVDLSLRLKFELAESLKHGQLAFSDMLEAAGINGLAGYYGSTSDVMVDSADIDAGSADASMQSWRSLYSKMLAKANGRSIKSEVLATWFFQIVKSEGRIHLLVSYRKNLFARKTMQAVSDLIMRLIHGAIDHQDHSIEKILDGSNRCVTSLKRMSSRHTHVRAGSPVRRVGSSLDRRPNNRLQVVSETPRLPEECVALNRGRAGRPIFWFHPGLGGVEGYQWIAPMIDRPFFGIQARGWQSEEPAIQGLHAMATRYLDVVRSVQPEGPYDFGGYSLGGLLAYEVTRQAQEAGLSVASIIMLDSLDSEGLKRLKLSVRSDILQTVNMALLVSKKTTDASNLKHLIHRDELDISLADDAFLEQLIRLARGRGLAMPESALRKMIHRRSKVQGAYKPGQFKLKPLEDPQSVECYYFRNRSGRFLGDIEPYYVAKGDSVFRDGFNYWKQWKKVLPKLKMTDVDSKSHVTLLSDSPSQKVIADFCKEFYADHRTKTLKS